MHGSSVFFAFALMAVNNMGWRILPQRLTATLPFNEVNPGTTMPDSDEDAGEQSMWRNGQALWRTEEMRAKVAKAYPLRRVAKPSDVASVVLFLATDGASFMTGQRISASGGYTMI
jgi:2-hydroxycyclohexanecarboxyl-CoA dehydrogenase